MVNELSPEEKRASIAAALLVELIGVDCEPIKRHFHVLVLCAALYIDKPSNHASIHNLLVNVIQNADQCNIICQKIYTNNMESFGFSNSNISCIIKRIFDINQFFNHSYICFNNCMY